MSGKVHSSVVRIVLQNSTEVGGGLLVDGKRILTSAEIVAKALGIPADVQDTPVGEVFLDFPFVAPGKLLIGRVVIWRPVQSDSAANAEQNIAVLELTETPPEKEVYAVRTPSASHYNTVVDAIADGELVPFFGAGINLSGRPEKTKWQRGQFLPNGSELAEYLARVFRYPLPDTSDLARVSQYIALMRGLAALHNRLRFVFDINYPPTDFHKFFARLPGILKKKGYPPHRLIVTTNYDDVLERAFHDEQEPFDLVTYVAAGSNDQRGKFLHWLPDGEAHLIDKPNEYRLPLDDNRHLKRSVILKIHGAVDRITAPPKEPLDSYVITEDHYIEYLTRSDISSLVPITLAEKLQRSSFLFLGYRLRDWNLRVILHRIWLEQQQKANYKSWAIQLAPEELELEYWKKRDVEIFNARLEDYIAELDRRIQVLPPAEGEI